MELLTFAAGLARQPLSSASTTAAAALVQAQTEHAFWYVSRAAGFTAFVLLFLDGCLGLLLWGKDLDARVARWRIFDLHQFTALLGLGFLGVHVISLLFDPFVRFTVPQTLVPFASPYRPLATALGVVALYLFVVVAGSFYVRRWIGQRTWRGLHYLAFALYLLALAHGIFAGTDTQEPWARALYGGSGLAMAILMLRRFADADARPATSPQARGSAAAASTRASDARRGQLDAAG